MQQRKGGVLAMLLVAALLTGFGFWQFGGVGLGDGEFDDEAYEYGTGRFWGDGEPLADDKAQSRLSSIAAERGWQIVKQETEHEDGRLVYELKLRDQEGRRHKLIVDARSGEVIKGDH